MKGGKDDNLKLCPHCKSIHIKENWRLAGTVYDCLKCKYHGPIVLEMSAEEYRRMKKNGK
ncbi:MAG: hypothetical protein ABIH34_01835 [Nanoarchaeota archaeon]